MKIIPVLEENLKSETTEVLEKYLLDKIFKLQKLKKEMNENVSVQKAQDALEIAKAPFKRARTKWASEIEALELELKSRNIKFQIKWDDIFEE